MEPLTYNYDGALNAKTGLAQTDLDQLAPQLEAARTEVLDDIALWNSGEKVPKEKDPLDAGFIELPERLLKEYREKGDSSELGQIIACGNRLAAMVDRVVVLGIGGSYMGARALMEGIGHPYHNELSRSQRNGRPRLYFEGNNVDNDAAQGLLDLLGRDQVASGIDDAWAIAVISKSGGTLETAVAFRRFLAALRVSCDGDAKRLAEHVVPVTGASGKLFDLAGALGCGEMFHIPDGVGGRFSVLTAVGLLPAAILGLDVVALLEGAAAMNERFRSQPPGDNPVLDYVGVGHLMEKQQGCDVRILSTWGKRLEALGLWYDQLLAESLGKQEVGALPLTVVNTRDLHSRGQQHQEGKRDKLITNLIVESHERDPLAIGESDNNQDQLNELAAKTLPDILSAAIAGTNQAYREDNRPTADLLCPKLDEHVMGQLFQMFMLATVVEGRLIGINPYGQPGVEAYKKNMNAILRR
ncbi:MAG: glucose-6-phosphate isomerase [Planctomycetales bacterium]|nr:glucose-6-phosphate isomerase [Planctomycetales bacterium]